MLQQDGTCAEATSPIQQVSDDVLKVQQGRPYPALFPVAHEAARSPIRANDGRNVRELG